LNFFYLSRDFDLKSSLFLVVFILFLIIFVGFCDLCYGEKFKIVSIIIIISAVSPRFSHRPTLTTSTSHQTLVQTLLANVNVHVRYMSSAVRLSVVCLTFVYCTQAIEIFRNISTPCGTLAILDLCIKVLRRSSQGTPPSGELNTRGVAEYSDFGPIQRCISETVQDRS